MGFTGPVVRAPVFQLRHCWGWLSAFCNADACGEKHRDCLADLSPGVWRQCGGRPGREGSRAAEREAFRFRQLWARLSTLCFYLCYLRQLSGPLRASAATWAAVRTIERAAVRSATGGFLLDLDAAYCLRGYYYTVE